MHLLVTGGGGFIGSHLVDRLISEDHSVVCLDNFDNYYNPLTKRKNIVNAAFSSRFTLVEGDIRDTEILDRCFSLAPVDAVVHLAARAGVRASIRNPRLYYDNNILGTLRLLDAMRTYNVNRLILGSSSSVYGNGLKPPFSETDPIDKPISPYASSKKASELLCHTFHHFFGLNVFCLRFFTVYGPRQRPDMAISQFARKIIRGEEISVFGDGTAGRDFTYIDDIIDGITAALRYVEGYEIVNLGTSRTVTINRLIALLENDIGRKAIINYRPTQPGDVTVTRAAIDRAKDLIGYRPRWSIEEGVLYFVRWLQTSEGEMLPGGGTEPDSHRISDSVIDGK